MSRFIVAFESTAAVRIEIGVEADDEAQAEALAAAVFEMDRGSKLVEISSALFSPTDVEWVSYGAKIGIDIERASVELDENGFDLMGAEEPDDLDYFARLRGPR